MKLCHIMLNCTILYHITLKGAIAYDTTHFTAPPLIMLYKWRKHVEKCVYLWTISIRIYFLPLWYEPIWTPLMYYAWECLVTDRSWPYIICVFARSALIHFKIWHFCLILKALKFIKQHCYQTSCQISARDTNRLALGLHIITMGILW